MSEIYKRYAAPAAEWMVLMKRYRIDFNSPVILGVAALSFAVLIINYFTRNQLITFLGIRYTSFADPLQYVRLFTYVFAHADLSHYTGNFLLILAVGPMVEEKYGSVNLAVMMGVTAFVTGLVHLLLFRGVILLGASGIVFMLILLASFTNVREGKLPITVLLVGLLYIGNEVVLGVTSQDNISRLAHILGGFCGAGFGFFIHGGKIRRRH